MQKIRFLLVLILIAVLSQIAPARAGLNGNQPEATVTFTFGAAILSGLTTDKTIMIVGADVGDPVMIVPPIPLASGIMAWAWVSAPNTATIRVGNMSLLSLTPSTGDWTAIVIKI